jgi:hypothetical protein
MPYACVAVQSRKAAPRSRPKATCRKTKPCSFSNLPAGKCGDTFPRFFVWRGEVAFVQRSPGTVPLHRIRYIFGGGTSSRWLRVFQRSPRTVPLHRVRYIFGGGTSSRCPRIFPAVTGDGAPPSYSLHIRWRDIVPMSARFPSGHRGRCPSIVFVTYSVEGHRLDVRVVHDSVVPLKRVELSLVWPILGGAR